jgi:hypothetical protein
MINCVSASVGVKEEQAVSRSPIITSRRRLLPNPHPGTILLEAFLKPMGLSQNALARAGFSERLAGPRWHMEGEIRGYLRRVCESAERALERARVRWAASQATAFALYNLMTTIVGCWGAVSMAGVFARWL